VTSFSIEQLYIAHGNCSNHREHILSSESCGCFYCLRCPHCGTDAVLPEIMPGIRLCPSLLLAMRKHFFDE